MKYGNIREEELKMRVGQDWFSPYDTTRIIGNIDFCVATRRVGKETDEPQSLLWAEAKRGRSDRVSAFAQLILTIGRARTFERHLPPRFLGVIDAQGIALMEYRMALPVFHQNDFNWLVAPSDRTTKEFRQLEGLVREQLEGGAFQFDYEQDARELTSFIRQNFNSALGAVGRIEVDRNNFVNVYQHWLRAVQPTIAIDWSKARAQGLIDGDFFLADLLSQENRTIRKKLFVLLEHDRYTLDRHVDASKLFVTSQADFNDAQQMHRTFWNRYARPPAPEYWDYIIERRDLLVPQDVRERKGSFYTPQMWVELSQRYLAEVLGANWQDEYYIWDCAAGTGNLLNGLTDKYRIWASTLDKQDVDAMHDRIAHGANLLAEHVFQFDFLNDDFNCGKLPADLLHIIEDPELRQKLVVYINPPYAEVGNARQYAGTGSNRVGISFTHVREQYAHEIGIASKELFAQFMIRVQRELTGCTLGTFFTLKVLVGDNFRRFRDAYQAQLRSLFLAPSRTFDNVHGDFPIGFGVWDTGSPQPFTRVEADVYGGTGQLEGHKEIGNIDARSSITDWMVATRSRGGEVLGFLSTRNRDCQNNSHVYIINRAEQLPNPRGTMVTARNLREACVFLSVRHAIPYSWVNNQDRYLAPQTGWLDDREFQSDCLAFCLFNSKNRISVEKGQNHWIPFTEAEVGAHGLFASHFMTDYMGGRLAEPTEGGLFRGGESTIPNAPIEFGEAAQDVFAAGRALWQYYHSQPEALVDAAYYDIRLHFQGRNAKGKMNSKSDDTEYCQLLDALRAAMEELRMRIVPKVYEYGFLPGERLGEAHTGALGCD